jgi:hypothetical protein
MLNCLKAQLLAAIHPMYLSALEHPTYGFTSLTAIQMYSHLTTIYSTLTYSNCIANKTCMKAAWMPPTPFEELVQQIEDGRTIATATAITMDDMSIIDIGYTIINKTRQFANDCKLWQKAQATGTQTWNKFKTFFQVATTDNEAQHCSGTAGYQESANHTMHAGGSLLSSAQISQLLQAIQSANLASTYPFLSHHHPLSTASCHTSPSTHTSPPSLLLEPWPEHQPKPHQCLLLS